MYASTPYQTTVITARLMATVSASPRNLPTTSSDRRTGFAMRL